MSNPYVPLLIMLVLAFAVAAGGLVVFAFLGPKRRNRAKSENFECGVDPSPQHVEQGRFPVRYYLVAMSFIVFDIEVVFLYPWAVAFSQLRLFGLIVALSFIALITVPYLYEWRRGDLDY